MNKSTVWQTRLIRIALWLTLCVAVLAAGALLVEWSRISRTLPNRGWNLQMVRLAGLVAANLVFTALLAAMILLYLWVRTARALPDLQ
ncbi:MAG: hypothetical protein ABGZ24_26945, partial [Fuerstiella sp.]